MKVFRTKRKPKRWEIVYFFIVFMVGFACRRVPLPEDHTVLRSALLFGRAMLPFGIGSMIGLALRLFNYYKLSPEDRRDEDRQDRDERNLMIRDRAAWIAYNVVVCTLAVISVPFAIVDDWKTTFLCLGMSVFGLVTWMISVVWVRGKQL